MSVYSPRIDTLIRDIEALGGLDMLRNVDWWRFNPFGSPDLTELKQILIDIRTRVDENSVDS